MRREKRGLSSLIMGAVSSVAAFMLAANPAQAEETKYAAFCMDYDSNEVLFDRYGDAKRYPASLTKMMTLALIFQALDDGDITLDTKMKVSRYAADTAPSKLILKVGSTITVRDAIGALAVKSANDVAVVVAEHLGGSEENFAEMMNIQAKKFAMDNTYFVNPHGLPDKDQVSTARDMTILLTSLIKYYPDYYEQYLSMPRFSYGGRTYKNHNDLVRTAETRGGKTGYTRISGFQLSSTDEQYPIGCTVMGGNTQKSRDTHFRLIMNDATENYDVIMVARLNAMQLAGGVPSDMPRGGVSTMAQITIPNEVRIASDDTSTTNLQQGDVESEQVNAYVAEQMQRAKDYRPLTPNN